MAPLYLLDSNVFIEPVKKYYARDLVPKYWTILKTQAQNGVISSIDKVKDEVSSNRELGDWVQNEFTQWESTRSKEVVDEFKEIIKWSSQNQHYNNDAKKIFADELKADAWVIAYAKINNRIVVTDERWNKDKKKTIPVPNACHQLQVEWIDMVEMLRRLKINLSD